MTFEQLQQKPQRFKTTDPEAWNSEIEEGRGLHALQASASKKKRPWRTLTGRQQFYMDHPWFLELGRSRCPHTRSRVRETQSIRSSGTRPTAAGPSTPPGAITAAMLRLQRGVPIVYMHPDDARKRKLQDNDWVRISQRERQLRLQAADPARRETQAALTMYHGWEKYLGFSRADGSRLTYIKIKPTQLVGGYGHVNFKLNYWGPTGNNRDMKVDIVKYTPTAADLQAIRRTERGA